MERLCICVQLHYYGARLPFFKAFCCSNHAKHTTEGCGNKSLCVKPHVGYYAVGSVVTVFPILNIKGYILRGALKRQ